jgi:hypothetical protein
LKTTSHWVNNNVYFEMCVFEGEEEEEEAT